MIPTFRQFNTNISENSVPRVTIVILNWNRWKDTIECLESLYRIDYPRYDVIVVDNASIDESIRKVQEYALGNVRIESKFFQYDSANKPIKIFEYNGEISQACCWEIYEYLELPPNRRMILIQNMKNYGFAEGNNIAVRFALKKLDPDYVLLLNNDVVVNKNFLIELVKVAENSPKIGIVGPKIYYYDFQGRTDVINFAGEDLVLWKAEGIRYGYRKVDQGQYNRIRSVNKIDGACIMIKREVFRSVGLLDSNFFIYWEENDFCVRTKKKGYQLLYVPTSKIWHKIPSSTAFYRPMRGYHYNKSKLLFISKNVKGIDRTKFLLYFFLYKIWLYIGFFIIHINARALISLTRGVIDGLRIMRARSD